MAAQAANLSGLSSRSQKSAPSQWGWVKWWRATTGSTPRSAHASRMAAYLSKAQVSTSPSDGSHLAHSTEIRKASHPAATARSRCSS